MSLLSRSLVSVSSLASREMASAAKAHVPHPTNVKNVTIIGAGLMGAGIAQVSAEAKINVTLVDMSNDVLKKSEAGIEKTLRRIAKKKLPDAQAQDAMVSDVLSRIKTDTDVAKSVQNADLVIEAIVENIEIKQKLFDTVEANAPTSALLATNTSSLRLADVAKNMKRKAQFGGLHFFNPVPMMQLVEVVKSSDTSDETFKQLLDFGKAVGKYTVQCKDTPGFIVNRLLVPYLFEAARLVERGDASIEDVDMAMKLGCGYPMGPFELSDYIGLDTCKSIVDGWHENYPQESLFKPSESINELVKAGKLGKKSGEGFLKKYKLK